MIRILFLSATGMAAFLDFSMGALIVFVAGKMFEAEVSFWQVAIGGVLALLPDFDLIVQSVKFWLCGKQVEGDHRATVMHAPLIMLPVCTLAGWFLGGSFWAVITFLCLLYHYVHDSRLFSVGDIDWLWPITRRELPWMNTKDWLEQFWLRPTKTSVMELLVGISALGYVANDYIGMETIVALASLVVFINVATWMLYSRYVR